MKYKQLELNPTEETRHLFTDNGFVKQCTYLDYVSLCDVKEPITIDSNASVEAITFKFGDKVSVIDLTGQPFSELLCGTNHKYLRAVTSIIVPVVIESPLGVKHKYQITVMTSLNIETGAVTTMMPVRYIGTATTNEDSVEVITSCATGHELTDHITDLGFKLKVFARPIDSGIKEE